jgi:hypothetical protein
VGCDSVSVVGCDTLSVVGCDTLSLVGCDAVSVVGCDTISLMGQWQYFGGHLILQAVFSPILRYSHTRLHGV